MKKSQKINLLTSIVGKFDIEQCKTALAMRGIHKTVRLAIMKRKLELTGKVKK